MTMEPITEFFNNVTLNTITSHVDLLGNAAKADATAAAVGDNTFSLTLTDAEVQSPIPNHSPGISTSAAESIAASSNFHFSWVA